MNRAPLRIVFYVDGMAFDGRPITDQAIGGSESAAWFMSRALRARGHEVVVFCNCEKPGDYGGVRFAPLRMFPQVMLREECDLFIAQRQFMPLASPIRAGLKWLWAHDVPAGNIEEMQGYVCGFADQVMPLSEYHAALYHDMRKPNHDLSSWTESMKRLLWVSKNGVDIDMLRRATKNARRKSNRMVYAARPERGLDYLLTEIWPKLRAIEPELELYVCSYDSNQIPNLAPEMQRFYQQCEKLLEEGQANGVHNAGALSKKAYWQLLASSWGLLYPTRFPEISCINALEAMALGTLVVTSDEFALTETVPYAKVKAPERVLPPDAAYTRAFVDATIDLYRDELTQRRFRDEGIRWVAEHYQWKDIAEAWETRAYEQFAERVATKGHRICEGLIYNSAIVAASKMALELGYDDLSVKAQTMLAGHHSDPDDYDRAGAAQRTGWEQTNTRWAAMAHQVPQVNPQASRQRILDVGCGAGGLLGHLLKYRENIDVTGIDFSPALVESTVAFIAEQKWATLARARVIDAGKEHEVIQPYDVVMAGEILEHQVEPEEFIAQLERYAKPGARIVLSVPSGPWESLSYGREISLKTNRPHVQDFGRADLETLFGQKRDFSLEYMQGNTSARNEMLGWWIIAYTHDPSKKTGVMDYERRWARQRPFQRLALCMIVLDGANDIRRCLQSAWDLVDEVHIAIDDRTTDSTREVLKEFEGKYCPKLTVKEFHFEDFSQARNISLEGVDAEWILWLDVDEIMSKGLLLRRYLETVFYEGYAINQHHVVLDMGRPLPPDRPIRIFRANREYTFYGCIHEDPGSGINDPVQPSLLMPDVSVVHQGYLDEQVRRQKGAARNLPLLQKDREMWPERRKGPFMVARDYLNIAQWHWEREHVISETALGYIRNSCMLYLERYAAPDADFHEPAKAIYQDALKWLAEHGQEVQPGWGLPLEVAFITAIGRGGLSTSEFQPERLWFSGRDELRDFMERRGELLHEMLDPLAGIKQRHTVLPIGTAPTGSRTSNGADHAPEAEDSNGEIANGGPSNSAAEDHTAVG